MVNKELEERKAKILSLLDNTRVTNVFLLFIFLLSVLFFIYLFQNIEYIKILGDPCQYCIETTNATCFKVVLP